jgi:hypothetical protein
MLGFIRLIFAQFPSETQHSEGHIVLFDPFNPTYRSFAALRICARLDGVSAQEPEQQDHA